MLQSKWNFEKFLIARDGTVVARFGSSVAPESKALVEAIEREISQSICAVHR
jgi:glutathione peroxidase